MSDAPTAPISHHAHTPEGLVLYPVARVWSVLSLVLGVVVSLSTLVIAYLATIASTSPRWDMLAFEFITLTAGVIAILFGVGKFREGPAMALLTVAGTVFAAAVLAFVAVGQQISLKGEPAPTSLRFYVVGRVGIAGVFGAIAVLMALTRTKAAFVAALKSLYAWIPLVIILAAIVKRGAITNALSGAPQFIAPTLGVLAGLAVIGFLSAAVHMTIRAFELARSPEEDANNPA